MTVRWVPLGTRIHFGLPEVGWLIALNHEVYRVRGIRPIPRVDWNDEDTECARRYGRDGALHAVTLRPARITGEDTKLRRHDRDWPARGIFAWEVYPDEHYPLCAQCSEPLPCREQEANREAQRSAEWMRRFETPGICPACMEPITSRQKSRTFDENVIVPLGPPVTFHTRDRCADGLLSYEDEWVKADPANRKSSRPPVCKGTAIIHVGTGTYECTAGEGCPGLIDDTARHERMRACGCPEHPGGFGPTDGIRNLATENQQGGEDR